MFVRNAWYVAAWDHELGRDLLRPRRRVREGAKPGAHPVLGAGEELPSAGSPIWCEAR